MIKGLPNINIYIMDGKEESEESEEDDRGLLAKMLKKKEKKDAKMLAEMKAIRQSSEDISLKTGGTSHVGGS